MKIDTIRVNNMNDNYKYNITNYVNQLLNKGLSNDYLFDNFIFDIVISPDNNDEIYNLNKCFLYRRLWESTYIKMDSNRYSKYNFIGNISNIVISMSLSEAILYIRSATPPNPTLQSLIPDAIKSIDSIIDTLKQFLIDDNSGQKLTYHGIFKRIMRFEHFETVMNDNRLPDIKTVNGLCYIKMANTQVQNIISYNDKSIDLESDMLFVFTKADQMYKFIYALHQLESVNGTDECRILNIYEDDSISKVHVSLYYNGKIGDVPLHWILCMKDMYKGYI